MLVWHLFQACLLLAEPAPEEHWRPLREPVEFPLRREPHILAAASDGQRELIFLDQDDGAAQASVEKDFFDLGRLQGVGNHDLQRIVPANDVDAFAAQLIDDILDATAANANTGAD